MAQRFAHLQCHSSSAPARWQEEQCAGTRLGALQEPFEAVVEHLAVAVQTRHFETLCQNAALYKASTLDSA